jgi:hypothetical protein
MSFDFIQYQYIDIKSLQNLSTDHFLKFTITDSLSLAIYDQKKIGQIPLIRFDYENNSKWLFEELIHSWGDEKFNQVI